MYMCCFSFQFLKRKKQDELFAALQKLKEGALFLSLSLSHRLDLTFYHAYST